MLLLSIITLTRQPCSLTLTYALCPPCITSTISIYYLFFFLSDKFYFIVLSKGALILIISISFHHTFLTINKYSLIFFFIHLYYKSSLKKKQCGTLICSIYPSINQCNPQPVMTTSIITLNLTIQLGNICYIFSKSWFIYYLLSIIHTYNSLTHLLISSHLHFFTLSPIAN